MRALVTPNTACREFPGGPKECTLILTPTPTPNPNPNPNPDPDPNPSPNPSPSPNRLQVLISGPADALDPERGETPYGLGLFEFHVFVPQG